MIVIVRMRWKIPHRPLEVTLTFESMHVFHVIPVEYYVCNFMITRSMRLVRPSVTWLISGSLAWRWRAQRGLVICVSRYCLGKEMDRSALNHQERVIV